MMRSKEDIERIREILGDRYKKPGRGMFVVLAEEGTAAAMSAGSPLAVYSAVGKYLSKLIAKESDSLAEAECVVKAIAEAMAQNARKVWEATHGTPDDSQKISEPLTEEQMAALIGRKRPGLGRKE